MAQEMEYDLNGTVYVQRPLVIGQVRQMAELLHDIEYRNDLSVADLIEALGNKLPSAAAIVLTEKGKNPRNKDIPSLSDDLEYAMTPEDVLQVIDDFFVLNPISSLLKRVGTTMENGTKIVTTLLDGLMKYWLSSLAATSAVETTSSGAVH